MKFNQFLHSLKITLILILIVESEGLQTAKRLSLSFKSQQVTNYDQQYYGQIDGALTKASYEDTSSFWYYTGVVLAFLAKVAAVLIVLAICIFTFPICVIVAAVASVGSSRRYMFLEMDSESRKQFMLDNSHQQLNNSAPSKIQILRALKPKFISMMQNYKLALKVDSELGLEQPSLSSVNNDLDYTQDTDTTFGDWKTLLRQYSALVRGVVISSYPGCFDGKVEVPSSEIADISSRVLFDRKYDNTKVKKIMEGLSTDVSEMNTYQDAVRDFLEDYLEVILIASEFKGPSLTKGSDEMKTRFTTDLGEKMAGFN